MPEHEPPLYVSKVHDVIGQSDSYVFVKKFCQLLEISKLGIEES